MDKAHDKIQYFQLIVTEKTEVVCTYFVFITSNKMTNGESFMSSWHKNSN